MRPIFLISLFILGGVVAVRAQFESLDPAHRQTLSALPTDSARVDKLVDLSYDNKISPEQARAFVDLALPLAGHIGYAKGKSDCLVKLGHLVANAGRYPEAEKYYTEAARIRAGLADYSGLASCYNNLGLLQKKQSNYDSAVALFKKGLQLVEGHVLDMNVVILHNNLGTAFRYLGKYEPSRLHFQQSMAISRQNGYAVNLASARMNFAILLQDNLSLYEEARDSLKKSLAEFQELDKPKYTAKCYLVLGNNAYYSNNLEQAERYYEQAESSARFLEADEFAILLKNQGRIFLEKKDFELAKKNFQASLDTFRRLGNSREIAGANFEIGNAWYEQEIWDQAIKYYRDALACDISDPLLKSSILYFVANAFTNTDQPADALQYREQYLSRIDTLKQWEREAIQEIQHRQENEIKDKKLHAQTIEAIRMRWILLSSILACLLVLSGMGFWSYQNRVKRRFAEQNEQIAIQDKIEALQAIELETTAARLEAQEETQKKIGQELHDNVGALLTAAKLYIPAKGGEKLKKASEILDQTAQEVRNIAHKLSDGVLANTSLESQLELFANSIQHSGKLELKLITHRLEEPLHANLEFDIFRMVQELVNNGIKHAHASKITIGVNRFDSHVNIVVEDNGCGFDSQKVKYKPGIGLGSLKGRVNKLGGEVNIDSQIGRGTTILVEIPLKKDHANKNP